MPNIPGVSGFVMPQVWGPVRPRVFKPLSSVTETIDEDETGKINQGIQDIYRGLLIGTYSIVHTKTVGNKVFIVGWGEAKNEVLRVDLEP